MDRELLFHYPDFEEALREALNKPEGAITEADLLRVEELYCSEFSFSAEDHATLHRCTNLKELCIKQHEGIFDFSALTPLKSLRILTVCGSLFSSTLTFTNISALGQLPCLEELFILDFDTIDLTDIKQVPQLTGIEVGWSCSVTGLDSILCLPNLKHICVADTVVPSLSFVNQLDSETELELLGVITDEPFDVEILNRFSKLEVENLRIAGQWHFCPLRDTGGA